MPYCRLWCQFSIFFFSLFYTVHALNFERPSADVQIVGRLQWTQALAGDDFNTIGRRYGVGYHELMEANPGIESGNLEVGSVVVLPTCFVLPPASRKGVVINLAELRLFFYTKDEVFTYPIGIGRANWDTPLGKSYILEKLKNPVWHVPKSIQEASKKDGIILPDKVLPGEDNPLGRYALRLHYHNYLIHGTNEVEGVGRRSTAGCIRMFPEDMQELFEKVSRGAPVSIIDEPYKVGWDEQRHLYLEAHLPLTSKNDKTMKMEAYVSRLVSQVAENKKAIVLWDCFEKVLQEMMGVPIIVGAL
jgi:L,D-transpeptidase ErfK/SrfK